jgi:hypothetical protein
MKHPDMNKYVNVNGRQMSLYFYNLVVSRKDLKLWKLGIKPFTNWNVTGVKKYFGLKGNKEALVEQIENLYYEYKNGN